MLVAIGIVVGIAAVVFLAFKFLGKGGTVQVPPGTTPPSPIINPHPTPVPKPVSTSPVEKAIDEIEKKL